MNDVSPHDARATASTYLNELGSDDRWIENNSHILTETKQGQRITMLNGYEKTCHASMVCRFLDGKIEMPAHEEGS